MRLEEIRKQSHSMVTTKVQTRNGVRELNTFTLWHKMMGHTNQSTIEGMKRSESFGMKASMDAETPSCKVFVHTKSTKQPDTGEVLKIRLEVTIRSDSRGEKEKPRG